MILNLSRAMQNDYSLIARHEVSLFYSLSRGNDKLPVKKLYDSFSVEKSVVFCVSSQRNTSSTFSNNMQWPNYK